MNASASMARPNTLTVMWRVDQAPRSDAGGPSGASPMSNASPSSPVASGPVNTPTADARNRPSLAACNATRNRASMESVGATPRKDGSRATPITCAAMPSSGTPNPRARGAGRSPANGANTSAVATAYRPSAIRCGTRTTGRKAPAPRVAAAGGRSGRHLPDEPHRHARNEFGVTDIQDQPRGRVVARVHDLEHHLYLLGRRTRHPRRGSEHFKHIARADAFRATPVDEDDLLRTDQHVEIPLGDHHALESPFHRGRAYPARVLERLERQGEMPVVDAPELHDHVGEHLPALQLGHARDTDRHPDPPPAGDGAVDPHDEQRVTDMERRAPRRLDGNLIERHRGRAVREPRDGGDGRVPEHATVGEALLLGQEARSVELAPAQRPIRLIRVGPQHVPPFQP